MISIQAVNDLAQAIRNPGARPDHHKLIMLRHREQWPVLWEAIDRIIAEYDEEMVLAKKPNIDDRLLVEMTLAVKKEAPNATNEQICDTVLKLMTLSKECAEDLKSFRLKNKNNN